MTGLSWCNAYYKWWLFSAASCEQTENQGTTGKKKRLQEVKYENLKEKE